MSLLAYPLIVARSDGRLKVSRRNGYQEDNYPAPTDQNYTQLYNRDEKAMVWKAKLAIALARTVEEYPEFGARQYILDDFPPGYTLWEYVKQGTPKRTDVYLYGHPRGKKMRYRSPQEFVEHLVWLCKADDDPARCKCKMCDSQQTGGGNNSVVSGREAATQATTFKPTIAIVDKQPQLIPGTPRLTERELDSQPYPVNNYLYRPGELVWFNKQQGAAWGLAVISMRSLLNDKPKYLIQPLSNPLHHPQPVIKEQEEQLRPWLAWSVPSVTHRQIAGLTYDQVPWDKVMIGELGTGDAEVDGSILKAQAIDSSYSLFEQSKKAVPAGEIHYGGMFLGAEKVWIEEPVRLRTPAQNDVVIMILKKIIRRETTQLNAVSKSAVTVVGDIYKFVQMPNPYGSRSEWPTPSLPPRMIADLRFRNQVAANANRSVWYEWRLLEPAARRDLSDVKGRWYETKALLPILKGASQFQEDIKEGITSDAGSWMNGRGDSSDAVGQRMPNRKGTLGNAVPPNFKVSRGLDGKPEDDAFPTLQQLQYQHFAALNMQGGS